MKATPRLRNLLLGSALLAAAPLANADNFYFDTDGTTEGFGITNKSVSVDAVWSTSSDGTAIPATYATAKAGGTIAQTDNLYFGTSFYNYSGTINGTFDKRITYGNFLFGGSGTIIVSTAMEIASNQGNGLKSSISGSGSVTLNGVISGNAGSITQSGSGVLTLSNAANSFGVSTAGATDNVITISGGGTIKVAKLANGGATSSLGDSTKIDATRLKFNNGTLIHYGAQVSSTNRDFTIQSGGATIKNDSVSTAHTLTWTGTATLDAAADRSLTLGGANTGDNTFSGALADNGAGKLSLTKADAGKWILSNTNTYTGATTITGGTLALGASGSIASSAINVGTGATFDVSAAGGFSVSSGKSLGGDGAVTGAVTFSDSSIFAWNVGNTLAVSGNLIDGGPGGSVFKIVLANDQTFADPFWNTTQTWNDVVTWTGGVANLQALFNSFSYENGSGTIDPTGQGSFSLSGTNLTWTAVVVPEPTSALAGLLIGAGLLRRRRA